MDTKLYTLTDAAKMLGISRSTIIRWILHGAIVPTMIAHPTRPIRRIPAAEINRLQQRAA